MSGVRVGGVIIGLALALAAPARAQEPPPETAPPTTEPPTTVVDVPPVTPPEDPTATTVPDESTTTTEPPADDPAANGDAPSETVPEVDVTIPPRTPADLGPTGSGFYRGQGSFASYPGRVVRVTSRSARARQQQTQLVLDGAILARDLLVARQAQLRADTTRLAAEERAAIEALEAARMDLDARAADAYIRGGLGLAAALISSSDANEYATRVQIMEIVLEADQAAIRTYEAARASVDGEQLATANELASIGSRLGDAERAVVAAQAEVEFANRELAVTLAGGNIVIHGFTFPVVAPFSFIDSFGFPRMTGTEYEHWHEGTDIFAPAGAELLAAERGVVTRMGTNTLGGITVWITGESRTAYYYAHLSGFAPRVHEGMVVEAGTVLGYVGNTGNAASTPSHLHFEVHPGGGNAVNPYPILVVAQDQPQPEPIRL